MSRWIDADTLRSKLMQYIGLTNGFDRAFSEAPSIDIVRCGECKHWQREIRKCEYYPPITAWLDDDFCSYGERREDKDYERAIEQIEHDTLYESTYNPEDGSM